MSEQRKSATTVIERTEIIAIKEEMKRIWKISTTDFLGFELFPNSSLSYHHIKKYTCDGLISIDNGALLVKESSHAFISTIEYYDKKTFAALQKILRIINSQRSLPTTEQLIWINSLLEPFEKRFEGEKSSRDTLLIKPEFSMRLKPTGVYCSYQQ